MNQVPWFAHILFWYYRRPLLGYSVLFLIALCWGLLPPLGEVVVLAALVAPWIFLVLIVLNLPFVSGLFDRLRLDPAKGRNHALEHGTVVCWHRKHGTKKKVGGRAKTEGFRIYGIESVEEIYEAFHEFLALDKEEQLNLAVSNRCGSMLVISQGIGILLLFLTLAVFSLWDLSQLMVSLIMGTQMFIFLMLRGPVGRFLQRYRFLSVDFKDAQILEIKQVDTMPLLETGPVHFVRTHVR